MKQAAKSDSRIYSNSSIGRCLESNVLNFLHPKPTGNYKDNIIFPYVFVADEGFAMKPNMLQPYFKNNAFYEAEFVFSYHLSRARRVIEKTFRILPSRFRIFRWPIIAHIETVVNITKACVALHNFLVKETGDHYLPSSMSDIEMLDDSGLQSLSRQVSNYYSQQAKDMNDKFKDYFTSPEGSIGWQDDMLKLN